MDRHLAHGYATTIHKAQGLTVDRALVLVDDTVAREQAYVALSRARTKTTLSLIADRGLDEFVSRWDEDAIGRSSQSDPRRHISGENGG